MQQRLKPRELRWLPCRFSVLGNWRLALSSVFSRLARGGVPSLALTLPDPNHGLENLDIPFTGGRAKRPMLSTVESQGFAFNEIAIFSFSFSGVRRVAVDQETHPGWTSFWPH